MTVTVRSWWGANTMCVETLFLSSHVGHSQYHIWIKPKPVGFPWS